MKRILILFLVSFPFILLNAEVTITPSSSGEVSLSWGFDIDYLNSGFSFDSDILFGLGVSFPLSLDEEGIHGEINISDLQITADRNSAVEVVLPEADAKVFFSDNLSLLLSATPGNTFDWARPFGEMISIDEDIIQKGSWYDEKDNLLGSTVDIESYYDAGLELNYEIENLNLALVVLSDSPWGTGKEDIKFQIDDYSLTYPDEDYLTLAEYTALETAVDGATPLDLNGDSYDVVATTFYQGGVQLFQVITNKEGYIQLKETELDGDIHYVFGISSSAVNNNLYTGGIRASYHLEDVGSFSCYAIPTFEPSTFTGMGFGVNSSITALPVMSVNVLADFLWDNQAAESLDKFEYELSVGFPVTIASLFSGNLMAAITDTGKDDAMVLDLYLDGEYLKDQMTINGAFMISDFFSKMVAAEDDPATPLINEELLGPSTAAYQITASYSLPVAPGEIIPALGWKHSLMDRMDLTDDVGLIELSVTAKLQEYLQFMLKYKTDDIIVPSLDDLNWGVITLETTLNW